MPSRSSLFAAIARHMEAEREAFKLKPWETCPVSAGGDPPEPGDTSARAMTWDKARELRDELLRRNPDHYNDVDYANDDPDDPPIPCQQPEWSSCQRGRAQIGPNEFWHLMPQAGETESDDDNEQR